MCRGEAGEEPAAMTTIYHRTAEQQQAEALRIQRKRSLWQQKKILQSVKDLIKGASSAQVPNVHLSDFSEREITKSCLSNAEQKEMLF